MKTRNTLLSFATAAVAALALSSCSAADSEKPEGGSLVGQGTGASCVIDTPIPIGGVMSLTGGAATYGTPSQNGYNLAVEELNAIGGVTYDFTLEDDQTDARRAISLFEDFSKDKSVIVGPAITSIGVQAYPIAQEASVPVLATTVTGNGIVEIGDYIYRSALTEAQVVPQTVAKVTQKLGLKRVVVLYANDDVFSTSSYQAFSQALDKEGVEVVKTLTSSVSDTDYRALLTEAKSADADALIVTTLYEPSVNVVAQARELGIDWPIIGGNGMNSPKLATEVGSAAENVYIGAAWNFGATDELNANFKKAYEAKYGTTPDQYAAQAYAGMFIVDSAIRSNCSGEREDIKAAFASFEPLDTVLGSFTFNDDRNANHSAIVQQFRDGVLVPLD